MRYVEEGFESHPSKKVMEVLLYIVVLFIWIWLSVKLQFLPIARAIIEFLPLRILPESDMWCLRFYSSMSAGITYLMLGWLIARGICNVILWKEPFYSGFRKTSVRLLIVIFCVSLWYHSIGRDARLEEYDRSWFAARAFLSIVFLLVYVWLGTSLWKAFNNWLKTHWLPRRNKHSSLL